MEGPLGEGADEGDDGADVASMDGSAGSGTFVLSSCRCEGRELRNDIHPSWMRNVHQSTRLCSFSQAGMAQFPGSMCRPISCAWAIVFGGRNRVSQVAKA